MLPHPPKSGRVCSLCLPAVGTSSIIISSPSSLWRHIGCKAVRNRRIQPEIELFRRREDTPQASGLAAASPRAHVYAQERGLGAATACPPLLDGLAHELLVLLRQLLRGAPHVRRRPAAELQLARQQQRLRRCCRRGVCGAVRPRQRTLRPCTAPLSCPCTQRKPVPAANLSHRITRARAAWATQR